MIAAWTPPEWAYNRFPLPAPDAEVVSLEYIVAVMQQEIDLCTEGEWTPLGRALHVAHMLVSQQGEDGLWSARLDLRTGADVGTERSALPRDLMERLNRFMDSTEFDYSLRRIDAGIAAQIE